ncbi:MAG: cobalamin B12-binding domain-containing protein [Pseudomonadota bacterium]
MFLSERIAESAPPVAAHPITTGRLADAALAALRATQQGGPAVIAERFVAMLASDKSADAERAVAFLRDQGISTERIVEVHVPAAARHLGRLWETDALDFGAVARVSARLTRIAQDLGWQNSVTRMRGRAPLALLLSPAGEHHHLGLVVAAQSLRRDGWAVTLDLTATEESLSQVLTQSRPDLVGVTVGHSRAADVAGRLLDLVGRLAPGTRRALGGPLLAMRPDLCAALPADVLVAPDANPAALLQASTTEPVAHR